MIIPSIEQGVAIIDKIANSVYVKLNTFFAYK